MRRGSKQSTNFLSDLKVLGSIKHVLSFSLDVERIDSVIIKHCLCHVDSVAPRLG